MNHLFSSEPIRRVIVNAGHRPRHDRSGWPAGRAGFARATTQAAVNPLAAEAAALPAEGQAPHPPVHEWRSFAGRYLRPQTGTDELQRQRAAGPTKHRAPPAGLMVAVQVRGHGQSGLEISEIFPNIAQLAPRLCVIRSMHTNIPNHEPSLLMMTCGDTQPVAAEHGFLADLRPGHGEPESARFRRSVSWPSGHRPGLWSNSFLPGIYQGAHINNGSIDPRQCVANLTSSNLGPTAQRQQMDLLRQLNETHLQRRGGSDNPLEARIQSMEMAYRMQFEAQEVFDLTRETQATRTMYGNNPFGNACLAARRLAERGVRVVQVFTGSGQPWDDHGDIAQPPQQRAHVDQPMAAC